MGAKLSQDVGRLMGYVPLCYITYDDRMALGKAVTEVETIAELPEHLRQMVIEAQNKQLPTLPV